MRDLRDRRDLRGFMRMTRRLECSRRGCARRDRRDLRDRRARWPRILLMRAWREGEITIMFPYQEKKSSSQPIGKF